ncbi:aconitase iron-sulfur domain-containing protein [Aspergillus eucalypticola CBS 122712]|uniref:Aconitase iron-sulfur domain-containing protein n=1 Tax=Aspergillus eucalypticola (strain CBS 122712 / IBT 29274) TaxID=1448314 RepID=A0A317UT84_ASPEC|nr:aconitase iron-sulfur domain-containing protein [Aspergillus eucalypticola CBS 122712]PWY63672.1 aconitase iron-sulfur domain-containing protein [Aspergillus eucalypticola CBS 122712]
MTLSEKIFALHDIEQKGSVAPGELIRVDVDWVIASEASWQGMERTYELLGKPGIYRNDRFWLAGDHVVDPRVNDNPKVKALIDTSERAKRVFKMTDYQGMNYTILHTEFYRERAQPGMVVVGSDSHTCSSGALGCLAIGLGAADVTLPLVTGETWFKVPESVNIRLVGAPKPGIGGKDTILYILQQLKRNTVAADRIVEFTGPGVKHLSCDARFAISNMTTEFGGITGIFLPDRITEEFIQKRRLPRHKNTSVYFKPDDDAEYAETHEIDLGEVRSFLAKYPNPDDVVPVTEQEGMHLDGCFIGACTTAEEDLILGALVLEQGLQRGMKPVSQGKRKVVPGSVPILHRLRELGLAQIYEDAGFEIGIPGCSYCVGMSADQAGPGEVWISSQNRNFENRMGKGSIGNLASAATVAASSFEMKLRDPHGFLATIDLERWHTLRGISVSATDTTQDQISYMEPSSSATAETKNAGPTDLESSEVDTSETADSSSSDVMTGKVQRLGDFIDTDALAPAQFLIGMSDNKIAGEHCLEHTHPEFRQRVKDGFDIVVAGKAFGCGSSREQAVMALLGCGVQCVIAKSYSFIFQRNMPSLGLLGITLTDEAFYDVAEDGNEISIDFKTKVIDVDGKQFRFQLSQMERELFQHGGIASAFQKFGNRLFEQMTRPKNLGSAKSLALHGSGDSAGPHAGLQW